MLPLGYEKKAVVVDNASFLQKDGKNEQKAAILELLKSNLSVSIVLLPIKFI